ncbi:MAG: winged helix-turn-helix transcriptional regulator [Nanoarchaeota archaeon]|nr:winged helix-turn-helix transcriptional regulator [DPANN group archaeon]MBL7116290.1 winged helix-turn-helix transcriptional regulator [Nanoarchaeota archaeon]
MKYVTPDEAYDYFLATLSNRNRIKILNLLLEGQKNVTELTKAVGVDQSTISNNLARLKSCGFVTMKPNGKERIYIINKETTEPLMRLINIHTKKYCIECIKRDKKK